MDRQRLRQTGCVRFGAFELDVRSGELRTYPRSEEGRTIVLQEQPLLILRILIELKGDVATRDDIKEVLWPDDRTVDFNHSTNVAIATLRRALGDSAGESQYIVTVARRGYRLIPPPIWVSAPENLSGLVLGSTTTEDNVIPGGTPMATATVQNDPPVPGEEVSSQTGGSRKQSISGSRILIGLVLVALLVAGGIFFWHSRHAVRLSPNDTVVLADISNQTSDPVFDDASARIRYAGR
jgi:eukaryotic-like serine/threonine-protein kinase